MNLNKRVNDLESRTPKAPIRSVPIFELRDGNYYDIHGNLANDKHKERSEQYKKDIEKHGDTGQLHSVIVLCG